MLVNLENPLPNDWECTDPAWTNPPEESEDE